MKKILIVDDSAFARTTLRVMLQNAGYTVIEASSGYEALELVPIHKPDLVTIDLLMPGMEGNELVGHLRKLCQECPLVVISADIQTLTRHELLSAGAVGYLNKPVNESDLLKLLESIFTPKG